MKTDEEWLRGLKPGQWLSVRSYVVRRRSDVSVAAAVRQARMLWGQDYEEGDEDEGVPERNPHLWDLGEDLLK